MMLMLQRPAKLLHQLLEVAKKRMYAKQET
jgi:hypothetical protein